MISTLRNKKFKYKICKKDGDEYRKNFTLNIGSKEYIAAAHETKFNCD